MKKIAIFSMLIAGFMMSADAATRGRTTPATASNSGAAKPVAARAATGARTAPRAAAPAASTSNTVVRGRAATVAAKPVVAARAGTTQKVINSGTKVSTAAKNVVVSEECRAKFEGCMDAFCMLDNETGGRCICSDKNAEYDSILAEIEKLDQQSYKMATVGVERLEMGDDAEAAMSMAKSVADSLAEDEKKEASRARRTLDLSMWDTNVDFEEEVDVFGAAASDGIEGKEGDALYVAAAKLCSAQIPECASEMTLMKTLYGQKIRSDCAAYENSLKQQKNASAQKLAAAEQALRQTALEQYRSANKYDLGQCTVQFKKCMQTTGGCGDDFSGCASVSAMDSTNLRKSTTRGSKPYQIKGTVTTIEISASTYDALVAKKPLCENITKSCVAVADQVWDTFLREVAPQVKSAELIAEDKARQDCIGNISSCFQKACKDTMDPNDPDGSYDMCLSRPETMLNLCKVPLNACGIDASSAAAAQQSQIWDFVTARLASMRVDSCTTEVKECLQSPDRCGEDYSQCIGLDLSDLRAMCPLEKLVGCQKEVGMDEESGKKTFAASWDYIDSVIQGIWLGIDNSMLEQCQNLVNEKMLEVCGDTLSCEAAFASDKAIGTDSLTSYTDKNGDFVIDGLISFGNVQINRITDEEKTRDENVKFGTYEVDIAGYADRISDADTVAKSRVISALQSTANKINQTIAVISQDSKIKMCVQGRDMSQVRTREDARTTSTARYPHLLDSAIMAIVESGIDRANKNYTEKYNGLVEKALETADDQVKSVLCAAMASSEEPKCANWRPANLIDRITGASVQDGRVCTEYASSVFDTIFQEDSGAKTGMNDAGLFATKYVISGAKLADLASVQQSGHSEYVQTDDYGNMLGRIAMNSSYSATNNTCTLTTTSTLCEDAAAVVTTNTSEVCESNGFSWIGGNGCRGGGGIFSGGNNKHTTTSVQNYHGTMCEKFAEPVVTTEVIKM